MILEPDVVIVRLDNLDNNDAVGNRLHRNDGPCNWKSVSLIVCGNAPGELFELRQRQIFTFLIGDQCMQRCCSKRSIACDTQFAHVERLRRRHADIDFRLHLKDRRCRLRRLGNWWLQLLQNRSGVGRHLLTSGLGLQRRKQQRGEQGFHQERLFG